jgi:hypothetical protein
MSNVVKDHVWFPMKVAQKGLVHQAKMDKKYDRENHWAAIKFLLDSLNTDLSTKLHKRIKEEDSFLIIWHNLLLNLVYVNLHQAI